MFHVSRNALKRGTSEAELAQAAVAAIRSVMPPAWSITAELRPTLGGSRRVQRPDTLLAIVAPDGTSARVLVECKGAVVPRDVASVADRLNGHASVATGDGVVTAMLVAPFVSPTTRAQLGQRELGWFDLTGNLRLKLDSAGGLPRPRGRRSEQLP